MRMQLCVSDRGRYEEEIVRNEVREQIDRDEERYRRWDDKRMTGIERWCCGNLSRFIAHLIPISIAPSNFNEYPTTTSRTELFQAT